MKADEREFLDACLEGRAIGRSRNTSDETIRDVIARTGINHKRAWYLLDKWGCKSWYNWGVNLELGWFDVQPPASKEETPR